MKRKLLSVLLTLCLAFSLLPTAALAATAENCPSGESCIHQAAIGSTHYDTLQEAVNVAAAGQTVTLLKDAELTETLDINKAITLDGANHKITGGSSAKKSLIKVQTDEDFTLTNCIFAPNTPVNISNDEVVAGTRTAVYLKVGGNATVTNNIFEGVDNGYYNAIEFGINNDPALKGANISGNTFTKSIKNNYFSFYNLEEGAVVNIKDNKLLNSNKNSDGIRISNPKNASATFNIVNNTFTYNDSGANYDALILLQDYSKEESHQNFGSITLNIEKLSAPQDITTLYYVYKNGTGVITTNQPVVKGDSSIEKFFVAKADDTYYKTLPEAVAAAQDGDTITLLKDCSSERVNLESKSITIDLNGNTLTSTSAYGVMFCAKNGHKITVNGTKEGSKLVGTLMVTNGTDGHIEINGGTYESSQYCPIYINGSVSTDNSTLTVKNATITASNSGSNQDTGCGVYLAGYSTSAFENTTVTAPSTGIEIRAGRLTLTNCNVTGGSGKVTADANGNGTTVKNAALAISQHTTKKPIDVTINGGTFTGTAPIYQTDVQGTGSSNVKAEVKNGQFNGAVSATTDGTIAVSGGTFSSEVPGNCCAPGFVPTQNGNTYGVEIKANMAAEVLDAQGKTVGAYDTLAAAITAAKNGETVKLLKDVELTSTLNLAKNITIDGQGKYTIKAANNFIVGKDNNTCCVLYVSGEVTLKDVTVNGNEKCRVIFCDKGKLTIDGATITNGKAPNFIGGVYMTSSASFEMKSGSITGNKNAELYQNEKYLQYSSDLWIGANANGALTAINGGTIGNVFVNANAWSASNPGSFTMNGGTVTNLYVEHDANYGATFKYNDGTIEHLYLSKENGNGQSIEVTPVKGVIYNGGVKEEDLVTLTLKYNDGATADTTYNVASGTTITLPTPAYRSGYTFNGWYDGSTKVSSPYKVTKNVILTASWSYNYSGGSSSYDPTYSVSTPSKTENGSVTVSPKNASKGDTVTVTVKPDSGYVLETLTVTDKNGNELTLKDKGNGKYTFTMPAGKVEVKATFMEDNSMLNFFYDVPNNAYFYEAVKWAVKNGITTGVGNGLFAPEQPCTRAQIVTFLWRAAGSPEPKGAASGMTDVVSGSYYEKAVAWAIENGITTGTTTSTFSPDVTCTRAQAVTFLARALKAKAASAAEFSDVPTDSYFADAVAWAAANGVTEGIGGGLFGSDNDCTRGQIVTFLYRAYNK